MTNGCEGNKLAVCSKCNAVQSVAVAGCSHASCGGIFVSQQPITELTATDWMRITLALKRKLKSLREIKQAIADGEQASLNEQDWAEIFYALDAESERDLIAKIGPDGRNMIGDK